VVVRPRLVATDLDGTLLRSDGTVSPRSVQVLARLAREGVPVVFVTARPMRWMADLRMHVGPHGLVVCSNGAVLLDLWRSQLVLARPMPAATALAAIAAIRVALPGAVFALEGLSGFAKEPAFQERTPAPGAPVGVIEDLVHDGDVLKLMARQEGVPSDEVLHAITETVRDVEVTASDGSGLVEMSARGVTKATTLALLCARFGVDAQDVVAFGDMPNDLPMLTWAGRSFAVAGAHAAVAAAATGCTQSNDDDGVAIALEALFGF
jgi:Cof subfamily protein (haloacid dehalogenase superfamily)